MSISLTAERYAVSNLAQAGTTTFSPTANISAGSLAVLCNANASSKTLLSVADNAGNTWTVDVIGGPNADGRTCAFASCQVATAITTANTITLTWSASTAASNQTWVFEIAGGATSAAFDASASQADVTSTHNSISCGPTATLSMADEIAFCVSKWTTSSTGWAHGSGWSDPNTITLQSNTALEYQIVSATTALTGTGTVTTNDDWQALVATYKGVTAGAAASWIQPPARSPAARFATRRGLTMMRATEELLGTIGLTVGGAPTLYPITISDTGVSQSDTLVTGRTHALTDTGLSQSDSITSGRTHTLTDTGLAQSDSIVAAKLYARPFTDTGLSQSDTILSSRQRTLTDTGATQTDTIQSGRLRSLTDTGLSQSDTIVSKRLRSLTDTGLAQSDTIVAAKLYARPFTDTGLSQSDVIVSGRTHTITDTGLTQSDSITRTRAYQQSLTDTGLSQTDTIVSKRTRALADTGLTQSDSIVPTFTGGSHTYNITITDTGLSQSDAITSTRTHRITDTGLTQTDTLTAAKLYARPFTDTGLSQSDTIASLRTRTLAATGLSQSDMIVTTITVFRVIITTGLSQSDSVVGTLIAGTGPPVAPIPPAVLIRVSPYHRDVKTFTPGLSVVAAQFSFPSSYTTGGVSFPVPPGIAMSPQAMWVVNFNGAGGYTFEYVAATSAIKAYSGGGTEVAPGTNLQSLGYVNYVAHMIRGNN